MISRRTFARYSGLSLLGASASGWLPQLAAQAAATGTPHKRCILLWMSGGPSQLETFDPKPGHENGGPTQAIETSAPGIQISEHLPQVAQVMHHLAPVRSMATKEGDHTRATYFLRTGYLPQGPVRYPSVGSLLAHQLHQPSCDLPPYISINPFRGFSPAAWSPGFLGPSWTPLVVSAQAMEEEDVSFEVRNLARPEDVTKPRADGRMQLLSVLETGFARQRPAEAVDSHLDSYAQALRMMDSTAIEAFRLEEEPDALRDAYGRNPFGQGCLLARRLIEHDVSFVEVNLSSDDGSGGGAGWDTHADNFESVAGLCGVLDPAWGTLMQDLDDRGLLQDTLVVWMGEFGRTPLINENTGRDHWPGSWSLVLGGARIQGGQVYGSTAEDGVEITDDPVGAPALMASICHALDLDHSSTNLSNIGRPIPLADHGAEPLMPLFG